MGLSFIISPEAVVASQSNIVRTNIIITGSTFPQSGTESTTLGDEQGIRSFLVILTSLRKDIKSPPSPQKKLSRKQERVACVSLWMSRHKLSHARGEEVTKFCRLIRSQSLCHYANTVLNPLDTMSMVSFVDWSLVWTLKERKKMKITQVIAIRISTKRGCQISIFGGGGSNHPAISHITKWAGVNHLAKPGQGFQLGL